MVEWLAGNRIRGTNAERTTIVNLSKSWEFADGKATSSFQMLPTGTSAFTLMMWVKFKDFSSNHEILRSDGGDIEMWTSTSGLYWAGSSSSTQLETAGNLSTSEWTHIAIARDGSGTDYLYVNGAVASATASVSSKTVPSQTTWYIGGRSNNAEDFDGDISQFLIYTDRKSTAEIQTVYNSGKGTLSPSTTNLQTHYNFAQTGSALTDQEGSNNCTASGTIVKDKVGFPDGSINLLKSLQSPSVGGWKEIARVTSNDTDVINIPDKRYLMVLSDHGWNTANAGIGMQINGDTSASQYPRRYSANGGTDATPTTETNIFYDTMGGGDQTGKRWFMVQHIANKSNKEKLIQYSLCYNRNGLGVNQAPNRIDGVAKWANALASINRLDLRNFNSGTITSDSEVVVLGWDPDDTHTTNFWEQLATASGAGSTLDSGTFTAKKYLWVQCYCKPTSSTNIRLNFNSDALGNYAIRESVNGGTDATNIQQGNSDSLTGTSDGVLFFNMFIINNAGSEKLWISHGQENSAGSNVAPIPKEVYGKWVNTSDSITKIVATSNFGAGSELKVWGSN